MAGAERFVRCCSQLNNASGAVSYSPFSATVRETQECHSFPRSKPRPVNSNGNRTRFGNGFQPITRRRIQQFRIDIIYMFR